jgi:hypothetical protein
VNNSTAEPVPLAGETGIANTPTNAAGDVQPLEEGQVFSEAPTPGTSGEQAPSTSPEMPDFLVDTPTTEPTSDAPSVVDESIG